ncbi:MAG: dihydrodipicolinate reductase C-terminal domain-containing protein, partial [Arenimonas sp.]
AAGERIPVLWASNFSLGVVVLEDAVRRASSALKHWNLRIVETHHVHKKDAPSGTALSLARAAQGAGGVLPEIESIREGEVVGDHLVRFTGPGETLEFRHQATDRDIFAAGAIEAANLLVKRAPGLHRLGDLLFG